MAEDNILKAIKEVRQKTKKRNFVQAFDLIINLRNLDLKQTTNRFKEKIVLVKGRGSPAKIGVIGTHLASKVKDVDLLITESKLSELEKSKKEAKKIANDIDFFIAEPQLMLRIGKSLGKILGPRGKMPVPFPLQKDASRLIQDLKNTVNLNLKDNPVLQCLVGNETLSDEDIRANIKEAIEKVEHLLPKGRYNIQSVYTKLTMGPAVKIM